MGRFMSPDWAAKEEPVPYANMDDPQSLNLYAYVQNNPLNTVDPQGHQGVKILLNFAGQSAMRSPQAILFRKDGKTA